MSQVVLAWLAFGCGAADEPEDVSRLTGAPVAVADAPVFEDPSLSGSGADSGAACEVIARESRLERRPADIIWVVDNSASMFDEADAVERYMNRFSQRIAESGVDAHIVVISACSSGLDTNGFTIVPPLGSGASCPGDDDPPRYTRVARRVGSDDALETVIETYPQWSQAMRPEATKTFVVVTDDDSAISAERFSRQLTSVDPMFAEADWLFSGIFCNSPCPARVEGSGGYDACAAPGSVYLDLVDRRQGVFGDLCRRDFEPVFDHLAEGVIGASPIECSFSLPAPPAESLDLDRVNVRYTRSGDEPQAISVGAVKSAAECDGDLGGWYYDDPAAPANLTLCEATCDQVRREVGTRLEVAFGCATRRLR